MHWVSQRIGEERAAYSYRWNTYQKAGLVLTGGSDSPVELFSPWINIYSAVARKDFDHYPAGGYQPEEKMSVYDAVCMFTKNLHYAAGQEQWLGTLETANSPTSSSSTGTSSRSRRTTSWTRRCCVPISRAKRSITANTYFII